MSALAVSITVLYPIVIWFGHGRVAPRVLACLLVLAAAARLPNLTTTPLIRWLVVATLLLAAGAIWSNLLLPLKLYPVLVNAALLVTFAVSLLHPPSIIERLARLREPYLPPSAIAYTRRVTAIWCGFFAVNGAVALGTAVWASDAVWSLYTGVVAYLLMAVLFGTEWLYRQRFKRRHHG